MKVAILENTDKHYLETLVAQNMKEGWDLVSFAVATEEHYENERTMTKRLYVVMMTKKERGPEPPRTQPVKL